MMCLKKCGMSIAEMDEYLKLCLEGNSTILKRKEILAQKKLRLQEEIKEIQDSIAFIDWKEEYYDNLLKENKTPKEKYAR